MMPQAIPTDAEFWRGYYGGRKPMIWGNTFCSQRREPRLDARKVRVLDGTREELEAKHEAELAKWRNALEDAHDRMGRMVGSDLLGESRRNEAKCYAKLEHERDGATSLRQQLAEVRRQVPYWFFAGGFVVGVAAFLIHLATVTG